jgi:ribosomal protein S18 acetylase RimI-like enzyme
MKEAPVLMQRSLLGPLPAPIWPAGIRHIAFDPSRSSEVHAVLALAYALGGGSIPANAEVWWSDVAADSEFDHDLCFIAESAAHQIVGFALVWNSAFIKDLVVHPAWQDHGIGTALLAEAFAALADRGFARVALKVQVDNSGARRLYERMGFVAG